MQIVEPADGWGVDEHGDHIVPRRWQRECLEAVLRHFRKPNPSRAVVHAVTGAGKSVVLSQFCACVQLERDEVMIISTSRQKLVRQISATVKNRLENTDEFMADPKVGCYYAKAKEVRPYTICCNDSMQNLADAIHKAGKQVILWQCDELQRSNGKSMLAAYDAAMPTYALGHSATPFLASEKKGITNFDEVIYKYGVSRALLDRDVIVPWRIRNWEGPETDRDSACATMMREEEGPGIVNADSIADAEQFKLKLTTSGYPCEVVHSGQTDAVNDGIIEDLKRGVYRAIIHIDMLTEGVDIRELRWMCLRRVVGSRVRFIQELGRGLRYYKNKVTGEEKTHLTVLDVNDLISVFRLDYESVLSGDFDPDDVDNEEESDGKRMERTLQQECFNCLKNLTALKVGKDLPSLAPFNAYLAMLVSVFDTFGLIEKKITARDWRRQPCTGKQVEAVDKMKWALQKKQIPQLHRTALDALTQHTGKLNRGAVADLFDIQVSLANKKQWPNFSQLDQVARQGLEKHEKKKLGGASVVSTTAPRQTGPSAAAQPKIEVVQSMLFDDLGVPKK